MSAAEFRCGDFVATASGDTGKVVGLTGGNRDLRYHMVEIEWTHCLPVRGAAVRTWVFLEQVSCCKRPVSK